MFSLFSKSSKGVTKQNSHERFLKKNVSGFQGALNTARDEIPSLSPYKDRPNDARSCVCANIKSSEHKKYEIRKVS